MNSKRGVIGSMTVMYFSTIAVIVILAIFILGSGIVKKLDGASAGLRILDEEKVGIDDVILDYMGDYFELVELRFLIEKGLSFNEAILEVESGK